MYDIILTFMSSFFLAKRQLSETRTDEGILKWKIEHRPIL